MPSQETENQTSDALMPQRRRRVILLSAPFITIIHTCQAELAIRRSTILPLSLHSCLFISIISCGGADDALQKMKMKSALGDGGEEEGGNEDTMMLTMMHDQLSLSICA